MLEMYLKEPGFICSVVDHLKEIEDLIYIYQTVLHKACFQYDMDDGGLKIYLEKQFLMKYYAIKNLVLPNTQNVMDIKKST